MPAHCNNRGPGTYADQVPMRNALPEDIAGAILFFAGDESGFVSGTYLPVSGGVQMP